VLLLEALSLFLNLDLDRLLVPHLRKAILQFTVYSTEVKPSLPIQRLLLHLMVAGAMEPIKNSDRRSRPIPSLPTSDIDAPLRTVGRISPERMTLSDTSTQSTVSYQHRRLHPLEMDPETVPFPSQKSTATIPLQDLSILHTVSQ